MKKALTRTKERELYHINNKGLNIVGPHRDLSGDCPGLYGNCNDLSGYYSGLWGNCTGVIGDCTGLRGNLNSCELTADERERGVYLIDLVLDGQ